MSGKTDLHWTGRVAGFAGARYLAIIQAVEAAIANGELKEGDRLPPQRELAERLDLNIGTVTHAYAEMQKSGRIRGEVGRGTFINRMEGPDGPTTLWDHSVRTDFVDLSHNFPAQIGPHPAAELIMAELCAPLDFPGLLAAQNDAGLETHRRAASDWLGRFGVRAMADDILVTCGAQHGLMLALGALTRPGDIALTEEYAFYGLKSAAAMMGRSLVGVRMDQEGIIPDVLENACRRTGARVLFCTPTLHNPTTATMSLGRRNEIVQICERYDVTIVEDDVYGFMPEPAPAPLSALAPDRAVHVSSISKLVGPGLRIGFLAAPRRYVHAFGVALRASTLMASPINAEWAARLVRSDAIDGIIDAVRTETAARQAIVLANLPKDSVVSNSAAFYFRLKLRNDWTGEAFARAAEANGVGVTPFGVFDVGAMHDSDSVRVCVNAAPDRTTLKHALWQLSELLNDGAPEPVRMGRHV
ncbi:aminotransferase-like domain-containing protein [Thauera sinica]|uniref:PLP-dependent aminotransferase family protein n=1 Tax=Thauera sinica TaxID=2665146 RepID=A0ABW1AKR3_9RHOO|nr:PLP-dependent aminotransferase family protein [Thauera sp. K11]ATE59836.1 GntR family transcriptional regulator [Thauera sp. K11]